MPELSPAGILIEQLRAGGLNYNRIAKALGRDSSLIGQIARGKKPGANLLEPLQALASGAEVIPEPARRTTKGGTAARVRQSAKPAPAPAPAPAPIPEPEKIAFARGKKDSAGRQRISRAYKRSSALEKQLREIAARDGNVSVTLYFRNSQVFAVDGGSNNRNGVAIKSEGRSVRLWPRGGIRAGLLVDKFQDSSMSDLKAFLIELAIENGLSVAEDETVEAVQLVASYPVNFSTGRKG